MPDSKYVFMAIIKQQHIIEKLSEPDLIDFDRAGRIKLSLQVT